MVLLVLSLFLSSPCVRITQMELSDSCDGPAPHEASGNA